MHIENTNRLKVIEQYLLFFGRVSRQNLIDYFDIGTATATRLFKTYKAQFPNNMVYITEMRSYVIAKEFVQAYEHDLSSSLSLFAYGRFTQTVGKAQTENDSFTMEIGNVSIDIASTITSAINNNKGLEVSYVSTTSGTTTKRLLPTKVFSSSGHWYIRALDLTFSNINKQIFKTYRLIRFISATPIKLISDIVDDEWNTKITLSLAPHTKHPSPEALIIDLGMKGKPIVNVTLNQILAGFFLSDKRVDCSDLGELNPRIFSLQLMNKYEIKEVNALKIAPGW